MSAYFVLCKFLYLINPTNRYLSDTSIKADNNFLISLTWYVLIDVL